MWRLESVCRLRLRENWKEESSKKTTCGWRKNCVCLKRKRGEGRSTENLGLTHKTSSMAWWKTRSCITRKRSIVPLQHHHNQNHQQHSVRRVIEDLHRRLNCRLWLSIISAS